ncbi:synaptosomal-associated protein 25 [Dioscorea alata]|uniref:Synaptosomal-associated protein 25 n=1 Tax=Dioscorea alata TaxID=55571 RepID=A0ACB7TWH2_DIOAL|nr:synaptosomal-associated protein 25 [Dioscorea alata]
MSNMNTSKKPAAKAKIANPFDSDSENEFEPKRSNDKSKNNGRRDSEGFDNMSVQELQNYAANKAEETTEKTHDCLRIAEMIREDASNTLVTLHKQGEQITRTHQSAVQIDQDLSRGETLLGSLGGFFSKPWKAKKTRQIKGPSITADDQLKTKISHVEQRDKLGLTSKSNPRQYAEATSAMEKVEIEKAKQDDALSDLSNILGDLKGMAVDMGSELDGQNIALDHLHDDVDELNQRVKGANQRARRLLGK